MNKIVRILFLLVGCIAPIFIGSLHTATHFTHLITPEIEQFLQKEFLILGQPQKLWNTWGVVNFMMGVSFIVIGLLNISTLKNLSKTDFPPILSLVAMVLYQLCVTYVGYEYEAGFQFYGGMIGGILISISLLLTLTHKNSTI